MNTRTMHDSMGPVEVPKRALYGPQTQRAVQNFPVSGAGMPDGFVRALALVKHSAATANAELGLMPKRTAAAISRSALEVADGMHADQFPVDVFQTGSGTSSNMNMNEVLATLAGRRLKRPVSPNDDVNMGQSSNDVIPTTIHVAAAIGITDRLLPEMRRLARTLRTKRRSVKGYVKTGRTHLMDAMPLTLSQELGAWEAQTEKGIDRLSGSLVRLRMLAQGGTAIGSGVNCDRRFPKRFAAALRERTGIRFRPNANFFESLSAQDTAVEVSGQLRTVAVSLMKVANDLRWMNSGPLGGLGDIELKALQPGSSIMPGKVNPVVPEACAMVCAQVIGNDTTVTVAGQSGNFQLNVMLPVIARNLLESVSLLAGIVPLMAGAIRTFKPRRDRLEASLSRNPILVTALNPVIGYLAAAKIAKEAYRRNEPVIDVAERMTDIPRAELERLLDPAKLTGSGR